MELLCSVCDKLIDTESAVTSYQSSGGKTVITDQNGVAHVLYNARSTAQKMRFRSKQAAPTVLVASKKEEKIAVPVEYKPAVYVPVEPPLPPPAPPRITPDVGPVEPEQATELDNDGMVDAVVYKFDEAYENGMCRVTERYRSPSLYNLMIDKRDVITEGKLTKDVMVRVFVGPADDGYVIPRARLVSIYAEQF